MRTRPARPCARKVLHPRASASELQPRESQPHVRLVRALLFSTCPARKRRIATLGITEASNTASENLYRRKFRELYSFEFFPSSLASPARRSASLKRAFGRIGLLTRGYDSTK